MPKLYFYDTGLAVALMGVKNDSQLTINPFRGNLFENLVVVEFLKKRYNKGKPNNLYFWRDNTGNEIDLIIDQGNNLVPIEIKSGKTISTEFMKGIRFWNKLTRTEGGYIVYDGSMLQRRSDSITMVPLNDLNTIKV